MNLLLLEPHEVDGQRAVVGGRRRKHLADVLKAGDGQALKVGVLNGNCGSGRVVSLDADAAELEVVLNEAPPPALNCTLLLSLQRPHTMGKVLQASAAMGVKKIVLLGGARVEKSYWKSRAVDETEMRRHLMLGLEQGRDTILPLVSLRQRFRPFVEDELPAIVAGATALVAHPASGETCPSAVRGPVVLAVGPEGGYVDFELELFRASGLRTVELGVRPLRTEFAVTALLGRLF